MLTWRRILLPLSPLYDLVMRIRNFCYDRGILKSTGFEVPVISVGNLTTGGTGKTPHIEYLIRLLKKNKRVATLSRGYGRKSKGFLIVPEVTTTKMVGDEPMQYHVKFPDIIVSVAENRVEGIQQLLHRTNKPQIILLDDAFQHRAVKAGLNILLIEYDAVFKKDYLLPAGNLREPFSSKSRADIIIVSKSPSILVPIEKKRMIEQLDPLPHQKVFFSFIRYGEFNKVFGPQPLMLMGASYYLEKRFTILLVTGIANPAGLVEYLRRHTDKLETLLFPDHHEFDSKDIQRIKERFDNIANPSKIIVTTEKDAMRLQNPDIDQTIRKLPVFYLPIEIAIHQDGDQFNKVIEDYVR